MGLKIEGIDLDNFDLKGPKVIVSNHQHNIDLFINAFVMPKATVSLGKKSIIWIPFFGQTYWLAGNILINRSNKSKAKKTMEDLLENIKKTQKNIWILPEGTRVLEPGLLKPFKKGAFNLAIQGEFAVVPVAISTIKGNISFKKWNSGTIYVKVLTPIQTKGLELDKSSELADKCHSLISENITELDRNRLKT